MSEALNEAITVAGIRAMKKQLMSATVSPGGVFTGWLHPSLPLASVLIARRTDSLLADYLLNHRTGFKNQFEGD